MALWQLFFVLLFSYSGVLDATVFTLKNNCPNPVWPGTLSGAGKPLLFNGGLELTPNAEITVNAPPAWSGRFWGRSGCNFDQFGKGSCTTGDCGGVLQCNGAGGQPPVSLAEFTLDSSVSSKDFYDVSLVDGFNIPISIRPISGSGDCTEVKCNSDLNSVCPKELQVASGGRVVACKSACQAFNQPQYCCTGDFNNPNVCKPTNYSQIFKAVCPKAYSYPYDDQTSTFTCIGANYIISFC